ncbi:hypothetical protein ACLB2K_057294 [Fragaria x ananassa]
MFKPFVFPRNHKPDTSGRRIVDRQSFVQGIVSGGGSSQCVICPVSSSMVAETLDKRNQNWFVRTKVANDLIIQVGDTNFHLHKLPMVMRSGYLNRLVFQLTSIGERETGLKIRLDNLPGGSKIFEFVVKFCYGWKVDLTASNVAPLYCAAHFLEMCDDFEEGNLMSKTEAFLSFLIFSSWKDTFRILKSCESISSWAKDFKITKRSSEAIAWKACTNLKAPSHEDDDMQCFSFLSNNVDSKVEGAVLDNWWFEDVSTLRVDHFIEVVQSLKCKGMRADLVGSCIAHWTVKWLSRITSGLESMIPKHMTHQYVRVTIECLIKVLPVEEKSVTCNFILHLLKIGFVTKVNSDLLSLLERRIAFMLDQCRPLDLLVRNYGDKDSVYDVNLVIRVVVAYVSIVSKSTTPKMFAVGRLVDGYLTLVAKDENLKMNTFQSLVEALPKEARFCDDNLYRAIDMYLKAHPSLTEEERMTLCGSLEYHRLSQEARDHVAKNDRLPVKITTRFILLEQVNMTRSMTAIGSNYRRTKTEAIVRVNKGLDKGRMNSQKELNLMTKEVQTMRVQLHDLHMCKLKLQNQLKGCII